MKCSFNFYAVLLAAVLWASNATAQIPMQRIVSGYTNNRSTITGMKVDDAGNSYITGRIVDTLRWQGTLYNNPVPANCPTGDILFMKIKPNGQTEWVKIIGENGDDIASAVEIDKSGNICIGGQFQGLINFDGVALNATHTNLFMAKYRPDGSLIWVINAGGNNFNIPCQLYDLADGGRAVNDIMCDSDNNIYFVTTIDTARFPDTTFTPPTMWTGSMYIGKLDSNGAALWGQFSGWPGSPTYETTFRTILQLQNGNIMAAGSSAYIIGSSGGCSHYPVVGNSKYFRKIVTTDGECLAHPTEDSVSNIDERGYFEIIKAPSGNLYAIGMEYINNNYEPILRKLSPNGDLIWHRRVMYRQFDESGNNRFKKKQHWNALYINDDEVIYVGAGEILSKYDSTGTIINTQRINGLHIYAISGRGNSNIYLAGNSRMRIGHSSGYYIHELFWMHLYDTDYGNIHKLNGSIFSDRNNNCTNDSAEAINLVQVIKVEPGFANYVSVNPDGSYLAILDTGNYTVTPVLGYNGISVIDTCTAPLALNLTLPYSDTTVNFGYKTLDCSYLNVTIDVLRLRRCEVRPGSITIKNLGRATATQVRAHVRMPEYTDITGADYSYTSAGANYTFDVGDIAPGESRVINLTLYVRCVQEAINAAQCVDVKVTPGNLCTDTIRPASELWDRSDLAINSKCIGDTAEFIISNHGQSMTDSTYFRFFRNFSPYLDGKVKLAAGDSIKIYLRAVNYFIRCELWQAIGHPNDSVLVDYVIGCGNSIATNALIAQIPALIPPHDESAVHAVECVTVVDSYDPNDKTAAPYGLSTQHYVPRQQRLTYKIRFQNTGTDTAYHVIIIDTLSDNLNIETIEMLSSSHNYTWSIQPNRTLVFDFANINLVDSPTNEPLSNGYIKFAISPVAGLANYTTVTNFTDIYFDYNTPVRTNTSLVTLLDTVYQFNTLVSNILTTTTETINVVPNPFGNYVTVQLPEVYNKYPAVFELYDVMGNRLAAHTLENNNVRINTKDLSAGVYIYRIKGESNPTGKLIKLR